MILSKTFQNRSHKYHPISFKFRKMAQEQIQDRNDLLYNEDGKKVRFIKKKVIVLGEGAVGKTTLLYRYMNGVFLKELKMTIGTDFFTKKLKLVDDKFDNRVTLLLWDFAGQQRFRFILNEYIKGAECVLLMFERTRYKTMKNLHDWIDMLKEADVWGKPNVDYFLVSTKLDLLEDNPDGISKEAIEDFQDEIGVHRYYETSSKTGKGIEKLFKGVINAMVVQDL